MIIIKIDWSKHKFMKQKILSAIIFAVICLAVPALNASAAYNYSGESNTFSYEINDMRRRRYHSSSSSGSYDLWTLPIAIVCVAGYYFIKIQYAKSKHNNAAERKIKESELKHLDSVNNYGEPKDFTEQISGEIRKRDGNFSGDKFIWLAENFFIAYNDAYGSRNINLIEELTTEDIFFDDKKALEEYIQNGTAHIRERVNFQTDYIYKYEFNDKYEYVSVYIKAKLIDYIEDVDTGDSIHGSKNTDSFNFYSMTLRRKLGEKTIIEQGIISCQCPNCGSNIDAVIAGKCNFCGQFVKTTKSSWRISALRKTQLGTNLGQSGIFRIS